MKRVISLLISLTLYNSCYLTKIEEKKNCPHSIQIQKILCAGHPGKACSSKAFTAAGDDLNGDSQQEWFFYGPSGECGTHGNCPLMILQKSANTWRVIYSGWGNAFGTEILQSMHQSYHDLDIASDSGPFCWTKDKYIWDGVRYEKQPKSTTYYLYDSDRLVEVSKAQWEDCSKTGRQCL